MKLYTFGDARQQFSEVLDIGKKEEKVLIRRKSGNLFSLVAENHNIGIRRPGIQGFIFIISVCPAKSACLASQYNR